MNSSRTILCVDDDDDSCELLKIYFEMEGHSVSTCKTHHDCFEHIEKNDYSAIILDCRLTEKDGIEICREIRQIKHDIPIVFYTADATRQSREEALKAGANDYLVKPNDLMRIVPTVMQFVETSKA